MDDTLMLRRSIIINHTASAACCMVGSGLLVWGCWAAPSLGWPLLATSSLILAVGFSIEVAIHLGSLPSLQWRYRSGLVLAGANTETRRVALVLALFGATTFGLMGALSLFSVEMPADTRSDRPRAETAAGTPPKASALPKSLK
ncbi:hypothetical protein [Phreatobacter sp. AB_2022a]|uniref:hypothetical protein n=1 Tax=Phreatobacter sp. AB_2022a TaxID=3003134 RepID=UPI0022870FF7|nr:hypothetical protein [Phreatobacter sp. AB_2022a]MCZ0734151.1 hypothetical protein [Phreatobacter sp. AB_2022a]